MAEVPLDERKGAVGLLQGVGDTGAPLEIFREENTKIGAAGNLLKDSWESRRRWICF